MSCLLLCWLTRVHHRNFTDLSVLKNAKIEYTYATALVFWRKVVQDIALTNLSDALP